MNNAPMKESYGSIRKARFLGNFTVYLILILGSFLMLVPLWWMLISSLKTPNQFLMSQLSLGMPENPQWNNFIRVWDMKPLLKGFRNSAFISITVVVFGSLSSALAAFSFSKLRFPGKDKLFMALLGTMMIPFAIIMIPQFIIYSRVGWLDTWYPLIVPGLLGNVAMIFFLRQYMSGIPTSMIESARIDGASFFRIFWQIMLPNAMPAVSAQAILWFMGAWNDYFAPSIYINDEAKMPIQVMIQSLNSYYAIQTDYPAILAASVLALLPVLIVFMIFQKQIISSVAMTGLK
ncbi:carbohydrate ABC transporter permease [Treponema zuelzerae]|uniref:Carbohydrate ABC transporter permease n=1 Tax=Teretinema zuelzerae TaxID=156 RepID=A0AAE3ELX9_9SPIR|nr:carbohydrate ABC transporter permease [Teretinema zuelzerae]MBN2810545.1 carbohydrate ABC transporter permease [Spirochaetales bacterium]MCD1655883.1 carbohydrate ABC transporter permease [Teretinema zuelzerae]HPO02699.1 carbohydrate ABC transporter permease [Treponemataceae bacterium]